MARTMGTIMSMRKFKLLVLVFCFSFIKSIPSVFGAEVDHYMGVPYELKDSTFEVNQAFTDFINSFLNSINKSKKSGQLSCHEVTLKIGRKFFNGHESKISRLMRLHPTIDRFPNLSKKGQTKKEAKEFFKNSIYGKRKFWPYNTIHLAPIININGLYIGSDKLGHIVGMGLAYYKRYSSWKKKGYGHSFSLEKALKFGIFSEYTILGKMASQVFSHADLEANYQGLLFYQSLCANKDPLLSLDEKGKWYLKKEIKIEKFITPYMNEMFNPSTFNKANRKKVLTSLKELHCDPLRGKPISPQFSKRMNAYTLRARLNGSLNWIKEQVRRGRLRDNKRNSLFHICRQGQNQI